MFHRAVCYSSYSLGWLLSKAAPEANAAVKELSVSLLEADTRRGWRGFPPCQSRAVGYLRLGCDVYAMVFVQGAAGEAIP